MDPSESDVVGSSSILTDKSAATSSKPKKATRKSKRIERAPSDSHIDKNNAITSKLQEEQRRKFSAQVDDSRESTESFRSTTSVGSKPSKTRRHKFASARSESVPADTTGVRYSVGVLFSDFCRGCISERCAPYHVTRDFVFQKLKSETYFYFQDPLKNSSTTAALDDSESTSSTASTQSPSIDSRKPRNHLKKKESKSKKFFIQIHQKLKDWWNKRDQDRPATISAIDRRATVAEEKLRPPPTAVLIDLSPDKSPATKESPSSVRLKLRRRKSSLRELISGNKTAPTTPTETEHRRNPFPEIAEQRSGQRRTMSKHFDAIPWEADEKAAEDNVSILLSQEESLEDTPLLSFESKSSEADPDPAPSSKPPTRLSKTGSRVLGWKSSDEMVFELTKISQEDDKRRRSPPPSPLAIMSMKYSSSGELFSKREASVSSSSTYDSEPSIEFKDEPKLSPSKRPVLRIDVPTSKITQASLSPRFSTTSIEQKRLQYNSMRILPEDKFPPSPRDRASSLSADTQPLIAAIAARFPLPPVPEHRPLQHHPVAMRSPPPPPPPPAQAKIATTELQDSKKLRPKKSGFLGTIFGGGNRLRSSTENSTRMSRALTEVSILGQPLERLRLVPLSGVDGEDTDDAESRVRVPLILRLCTDYLGKEESLSTIGLFRESGSMQKRKQYLNELGNPALDRTHTGSLPLQRGYSYVFQFRNCEIS
jgi:hypothetical protein